MLLLLFVAVTDNSHMAMDCFISVVFCQLRVSIRDRSKLKKKQKMKIEEEVGSGYIGVI